MGNGLTDDLDHILRHTQGLWEPLRGGRIFITGGTGFFGKWLLECFAWANDKLALDAHAVILTRDASSAPARLGPVANHPAITFHAGDVRDFSFPPGRFTHVIHGATTSSQKLAAENPTDLFFTTFTGTRHTLNFAQQAGAVRFLLISSGAVYGTQPPALLGVSEACTDAPNSIAHPTVYGEGKWQAEQMCLEYPGVAPAIARCFAFVGPHLPLDAHFAVGNFIRDGLAGGPIVVAGDGTPFRSYLYTSDLMIWLWTILFRGAPGQPYNVGSEDAISIADLAHLVADVFGTIRGRTPEVKIAGTPQPGVPAPRYVPSTRRAFDKLGLRQYIDLRTAITKTIRWHLNRNI